MRIQAAFVKELGNLCLKILFQSYKFNLQNFEIKYVGHTGAGKIKNKSKYSRHEKHRK